MKWVGHVADLAEENERIQAFSGEDRMKDNTLKNLLDLK